MISMRDFGRHVQQNSKYKYWYFELVAQRRLLYLHFQLCVWMFHWANTMAIDGEHYIKNVEHVRPCGHRSLLSCAQFSIFFFFFNHVNFTIIRNSIMAEKLYDNSITVENISNYFSLFFSCELLWPCAFAGRNYKMYTCIEWRLLLSTHSRLTGRPPFHYNFIFCLFFVGNVTIARTLPFCSQWKCTAENCNYNGPLCARCVSCYCIFANWGPIYSYIIVV